MNEADTAPLANALSKIGVLVNASESDPQMMLDLLNDIIDTAEAGKNEYRANFMAAQKAEIAELRARGKA